MASRPMLTAAALVLAVTGVAASRELQQQPAPYWYVSYYQVEWSKVDSLSKLVRAYTLPIVEEQKKLGTLLDYRILIHSHGSRDNVVIVRKLASWAAIDRDTTLQIAYRRVFPDSLKRKEINGAFNWVFAGGLHRDEIYREVVR